MEDEIPLHTFQSRNGHGGHLTNHIEGNGTQYTDHEPGSSLNGSSESVVTVRPIQRRDTYTNSSGSTRSEDDVVSFGRPGEYSSDSSTTTILHLEPPPHVHRRRRSGILGRVRNRINTDGPRADEEHAGCQGHCARSGNGETYDIDNDSHSFSRLSLGRHSIQSRSGNHQNDVAHNPFPDGDPGPSSRQSRPPSRRMMDLDSHTPPPPNSPRIDTQTSTNSARALPYIVLGVIDSSAQLVHHETLMSIRRPESLFTHIRAATHRLRGYPRRILSLKRVAGFGIYACSAGGDFHSIVAIDARTQRTLAELWREFQSGEPDYNDRWMRWTQRCLNGGSLRPEEGRYGLSLRLKWSAQKFMIYGGLCIAVSVVVGVAYTYVNTAPGAEFSDRIAVAQTAWTIASYSVTAAGGKFCFRDGW
ncbi:hypothetical protein BT63DRAFT_5143 [Microthyrium microscopicum]|uniref:Uncharacterized protein n=1 Tax=Microthyrium microscopicum TaxID=703497 RepID=A0A6A6UR51_9PEZI|nr:hypothetical protein BT63DRAFT_5143 [Microthyrium microscopicum]